MAKQYTVEFPVQARVSVTVYAPNHDEAYRIALAMMPPGPCVEFERGEVYVECDVPNKHSDYKTELWPDD